MSPSWYFEPIRGPYQKQRYLIKYTHLEKRLLKKINMSFIFPLKLKNFFKKTYKNWKLSQVEYKVVSKAILE